MADISKELLTPTLDNHRLIIELTHELSLLMLSIGLFAQQIIEFVDESQGNDSLHALREALTLNSYLFAEAQLGLYTVRNFLSHFSESSDRRSIKPRFEEIDVRLLLSEMIDVYGRHAKFKEVSINVEGLADLPKIRGIGSELRRAFHNVLNNAVKYSYHSVSIAQRSIRIRAKVPYDPGFKRRRFALSFENYGLGTTRKRPAEFLSPASAANRRSMKYLSDLVLACQRFAK
jgi:signal transduction histidine kinase